MIDVYWELIAVIALILLNGYLAMSEMSLVSSRRPRIQQLASEGQRDAQRALALIDAPGRFLSTVQFGITLVGILAGAFGGATLAQPLATWLATFPTLAPVAQPLAIGAVVITITLMSLIVGELVPKRIALNNAERIALTVAGPMTALATMAAPAVWLLEAATRLVLRLLRQPLERSVTVTEEEVKSLIAEGTEAGVFHVAERDMIDGVLKLADRPVRAIMTPRVDVVWIGTDDDPSEILQIISESGHTRFPVSRTDIDGIEGVVHTKDLLERTMRGEPLDILACMKVPPFVHESTTVLKVIEILRSSAAHFAIVVDEYGGLQGLVSPTDILGAIAGEFPETLGEIETNAVQREDGSWLMDGMTTIDEVEHLLGRNGMQSDGEYYTLAGFVLWHLGHLPRKGERLRWRDLIFEVVDLDGRRIDQVMVIPPESNARKEAGGQQVK